MDLILMLNVDIFACVAIYVCIERYNVREKSQKLALILAMNANLSIDRYSALCIIDQ